MTTVAWDGKTLAADRQQVNGDTPTRTRKVFKLKGTNGGWFLVGCCGHTDDIIGFVKWFTGKGAEPRPDSLTALVIDDALRVWTCGEKLIYSPVYAPCWSCGSGADFALGAMHAGVSARRAVLIATKLDINTGMGVDTISFGRKR